MLCWPPKSKVGCEIYHVHSTHNAENMLPYYFILKIPQQALPFLSTRCCG